eukprot:8135458-Pyramimonas_sp.AAC.1
MFAAVLLYRGDGLTPRFPPPPISKRAGGRNGRKRACARGRVGSSGRPPRYDCASSRGARLLSRPKGSSYCLRWHILSYWDCRCYGEAAGWASQPPFKLGSGVGLWWSALALFLAIHGTAWWTTGCSGFARRNVHRYAVPQGHLHQYLCSRGGLLLTSYLPALLHS